MDNKSKCDISLQLNVYTLSYETHVFGLHMPGLCCNKVVDNTMLNSFIKKAQAQWEKYDPTHIALYFHYPTLHVQRSHCMPQVVIAESDGHIPL